MTDSPTLYLVPTPIGNLEDMTRRAERVLREVDVVYAEDTRTAQKLFRLLDIEVQKLSSLFEGNEVQRATEIVALLRDGKSAAVISEAGTPGISDPGHAVIQAVVAAGLVVCALPGPVAATTALVASGLPTDSFLFVGFLPRTEGERRQRMAELRSIPATLVLYESPERVGTTLAELSDSLGERQAVLARELSKMHEEFSRGSLAELAERYAEQKPRGECVLVVAGAAFKEETLDPETVVRDLLKEGYSPKDVAQRAMVKTGKPRRQLYQLALALKRQDD